MTKLEEIKQRWSRMGALKYDLGFIMSLDKIHSQGPYLVVANNRPLPEGAPKGATMCMIVGPRSDPDTLEDAIAYIEAPDDVKFLLEWLEAARADNTWAYAQGYHDGEQGLEREEIQRPLEGVD